MPIMLMAQGSPWVEVQVLEVKVFALGLVYVPNVFVGNEVVRPGVLE